MIHVFFFRFRATSNFWSFFEQCICPKHKFYRLSTEAKLLTSSHFSHLIDYEINDGLVKLDAELVKSSVLATSFLTSEVCSKFVFMNRGYLLSRICYVLKQFQFSYLILYIYMMFPSLSFEAVYCYICGLRRVAVARYRMICLVLLSRITKRDFY